VLTISWEKPNTYINPTPINEDPVYMQTEKIGENSHQKTGSLRKFQHKGII
jgi:hypothetical protein